MSKAKKVPFRVERIYKTSHDDWTEVDPAYAWEELERQFPGEEMDKIIEIMRGGLTVATDFAHWRIYEEPEND